MLPVLIAGVASAVGSHYITKNTATDVIEASQSDAPLVQLGNQMNFSTTTLIVIALALGLGGFFTYKKIKG